MSKKPTMAFAYTVGISVSLLELVCYISFFHHIYNHNNTIAANILTPAVIKNRNQVINFLERYVEGYCSKKCKIWYD